MSRCITIILLCAFFNISQAQQAVKKLKGFEANCEAAIQYFLSSDINGEEFFETMTTADNLLSSYQQAEKKQFGRTKDTVRYAKSLLKTSFVKLVMQGERQDPEVYQSGKSDLETALRLMSKNKLKKELLPVYVANAQYDFAQNPDRIPGDLDDVKSVLTDSSYLYLSLQAVHERNKGRFLKAETIALRSKKMTKPASSELYQVNRLLQSIYNTLGEDEKALKIAEENTQLIASRGRRHHPEYYWSVLTLSSHYMEMAQWEKARKLCEQNIRDMTGDGKTAKLFGETRVLFNSYNRLMWLNHDTGDKNIADSLFQIQENIVRNFSNKDDDLYADNCAALAEYYDEAKSDYDSAIVMQKIVLAFGVRTHIRLFEMEASAELSYYYRRKKDYALSKAYVDSALSIAVALHRPGNFTNYTVRKAKIMEKQGRLVEAERLLKQAIDSTVAYFGFGSGNHNNMQLILAFFYLRNKQLEKAEPVFLQDVKRDMDKITRTFSGLTEAEREAQSLVVYEDKFNDFNYFAMQRGRSRPALTAEMYDVRLFTKGLLLIVRENGNSE